MILTVALLSFLYAPGSAGAADWPMWRYDASRTAASPQELPAELHLHWKRQLPEPKPSFPEDVRLAFDLTYEPVVMGHTIFVPSMVTDSVTAFDTRTGEERWQFFAEAPVRFAPVAWRGKVYFVSDDGYLYCVDAEDGSLLWKVCGVRETRKGYRMLGNERIVSRWPARGAPVLHDGTIYFGAGMWPFEGVCACAVDAETGDVKWRNSEVSFIEDGLIDHAARRNIGLSPQGYFAVLDDRLAATSGRALPMFLDLKTGKHEPYTTGWGGRAGLAKGTWRICGAGDYYWHGGALFGLTAEAATIDAPEPPEWLSYPELARRLGVTEAQLQEWAKNRWIRTRERDGRTEVHARSGGRVTYVARAHFTEEGEKHSVKAHPRLQPAPSNRSDLGVYRQPVVTGDTVYYSRPVNNRRGRGAHWPDYSYEEIVACDTTDPRWGLDYSYGWGNNRRIIWKSMKFRQKWALPADLKVHLKAGSRLYGRAPGKVAAVQLPENGGKPKVAWRAEVEGTPWTMLAADDRLFAVTKAGTVYCFGAEKRDAKTYPLQEPELPEKRGRWSDVAGSILDRTDADQGYCLALGQGSGGLVMELLRSSTLHVVVLEPDAKKAAKARREYASRGLYGTRVHVITGDLASVRLAPYWARLVVSEQGLRQVLADGTESVGQVCDVLRPYGGTALLPSEPTGHERLSELGAEVELAGAEIRRSGDWSVLERPGALPDSEDWTHEAGNAGNTFSSLDDRVKPPFGVLWFGGSVDRIFPPWDYTHNRGPFPVVCDGRMFILVANEVHAADIYTGRHLWNVTLSPSSKTRARLKGHMITQRPTADNFVVAPDSLYVVRQQKLLRLHPATGARQGTIRIPKEANAGGDAVWDEVRLLNDRILATVGARLLCMDRHSGELLWSFEGERERMNFAAGDGRVFCVNFRSDLHRHRGEKASGKSMLFSLDASDGGVIWRATATTPPDTAGKRTKNRFRPMDPYVSYSEVTDTVFLTATRSTVAAYDGADGVVVWRDGVPARDLTSNWSGPEPPIVLPDRLITHAGQQYDPKTGKKSFERLYNGMNRAYNQGGTRGCNRAIANQHVLTLRDAHAAYFDLQSGRETFLRGIRSGCTNDLLPAGGILNGPNFSHGCICNWPIWTSFAMVHMPEAERWRSELGHEVAEK